MNRVTEKILETEIDDVKTIYISVKEIIEDHNERRMPTAIQKKLAYIRTDLDRFSKIEIEALRMHGSCVASKNLQAYSQNNMRKENNQLFGQDFYPNVSKSLGNSHKRQWINILFDLKDWTAYFLSGTIIILFFGLILISYNKIIVPINQAEENSKSLINTATEQQNELIYLKDKIDNVTSRFEILSKKLEESYKLPKSCTHPSHGIERYLNTFVEKAESEWVKGGSNQLNWCAQAITEFKRKYTDASIAIKDSSEIKRSTCSPFNCTEYKYFCNIEINKDPVFIDKVSAACNE
jgi:hypothetical protein